MKSTLPKVIYVAIDGKGDDAYYQTYESAEEHAEFGTLKKVAVYRLDQIVKVGAKATIKP